MTTWQVSILVALIGQLPVLATLFRVNQVHGKVQQAANGQHRELVLNQQDMLRRMDALEEEVSVVYRAVVAESVKNAKPRRKWLTRQ